MAGFRGFGDFSLHDLGRINLLAGSNNGGRTSVLEAVELLASQVDLRADGSGIHMKFNSH